MVIWIVVKGIKDIEIICVDDGSTDNSLSILQEYAKKDDRIRLLKQLNKGSGNARNNGIRIARGEYIGFVDSDDYVTNNYFASLYNSAITSNSDIAATKSVRMFDSNKNVFKKDTGLKNKYKISNIKDKVFYDTMKTEHKLEFQEYFFEEFPYLRKKEIIVSLTSYPARINTVHLTIKSLINQTLKADKLILWLAPEQFKNKEDDLPKELLDLQSQGLIPLSKSQRLIVCLSALIITFLGAKSPQYILLSYKY